MKFTEKGRCGERGWRNEKEAEREDHSTEQSPKCLGNPESNLVAGAQRGRKSKARERGRKGTMPSLVRDFCLCRKINGKCLEVLSGRMT